MRHTRVKQLERANKLKGLAFKKPTRCNTPMKDIYTYGRRDVVFNLDKSFTWKRYSFGNLLTWEGKTLRGNPELKCHWIGSGVIN
ncbi:hypothetical protein [Bacillus cereus]|uniref:hypothetical protein n=1 Tax=Bacillus cereus TaxID=1396 RepID=UPI0011A66664|nr:hypothetical protein [Bacillus cereus]